MEAYNERHIQSGKRKVHIVHYILSKIIKRKKKENNTIGMNAH